MADNPNPVEKLYHEEYTTPAQIPFENDPGKFEFGLVRSVKPTPKYADKFKGSFVLKHIPLEIGNGERVDVKSKEIFLKEARALWYARHKHVIEIAMSFTYEGVQDPYFAIIMERANQNIQSHLNCQQSPPELEKISGWFKCLANAVAYIHSIGIRHRDIKPANILLKDDGRVMLADFGISKMGLGKTLSTTSMDGARAHTPRYAAPEVDSGATRGRQADIFSLGAVFLEMLIAHSFGWHRPKLVGIIAGDGQSPATYARRLNEVLEWIDHVQKHEKLGENDWRRQILQLCRGMMSELREERPSADEVYTIVSKLESPKETLGPCMCAGANMPLTNNQRLVKACQRSNGLEEVESLLKNCRIPAKGAIQQAAVHGFLDIIHAFFNMKADLDQQDYSEQTALHCAAAYGHRHVVEFLLQQNVDITKQDEEGQIPLHCASGQGHLEIVKLLLDKDVNGSSIDTRDTYGQMPLSYAAKRGYTEVARVLIEKMKDGNKQDSIMKPDERQCTALHLAAGSGSIEVVGLLLEAVTEPDFVNEEDDNRFTALHWAVMGKHHDGKYEEIIKILLDNGVNVKKRGGKGKEKKTALEYARDCGHLEMITLIERATKTARYAPGAELNERHRYNVAAELLLEVDHIGKYTDADVSKVSVRLEKFQKNWQHFARVSMVLLNIDDDHSEFSETLAKFEKQNLTDYRLPFTTADLEKFLTPGVCKRFQKEQSNALTEKFSFREFGEHENIKTSELNNNLQTIKILGSGSSGLVQAIKNKENGSIYALKFIKRGSGDNERRATEELRMLKRARHANVVSFVGSFTSPEHFGLLMEPAAEYNLATYLAATSSDPTKKSSLLGFCGCLVNALRHLHNEVYINHNDIKPENILVHRGSVLLTDFGISMDWSETLRTTMWGPAARTPMYCAPEVTQDDQSRNSSADIWSLGCVLLEIVTVYVDGNIKELKDYVKGQNGLFQAYNKNPKALQQWINILLEARKIESLDWLRGMLQPQQDARPTAVELQVQLKSQNVPGLSFFGDCCKATSREKELVNRYRQETDSEEIIVEQHTSVAAVSWTGECRSMEASTKPLA
ncbi:hypothetical protein ACHAPV_000357 [Trichoderma viride]